MALRKTTYLVVFALLAILTGGTSLRAQEGKTEHAQEGASEYRKRASKIDLDRPADPGSRFVQITQGRPIPSMNAAPANAEFPPPKYKTSGREFILVFPSIIGSDDDAANPSQRRIYITSRGRTRVKIKFVHRPWEKDTVTVPGVMCVIDIPDWGVLRQTHFENIYDLGITVEAEDDITCYGYSHEGLSSDGWLVLPKEALGQRYYVASQRNSLNYGGSWMDPYQPRSNLVIVGTEDATIISFKLSALSQTGRMMKDSIYSIILNRGEVFPIMARDTGIRQSVSYVLQDRNCNLILDANNNPITAFENAYVAPAPGADCDLTGSEIWSDKPIAVYGGHERASTPDMNEFDLNRLLRDCELGISRDHLTEQMPPVELWGSEFVVMGSRKDLWSTRTDEGDMVRIISANDNTVITVNGVTVANLNAGKYYQFSAGPISHIFTSQPALVVKYMKSMTKRATENRGDPDMTVVPPIENLATAYTIPIVDNRLIFRELYLNILVHDSGISSLRVNGKTPQSPAKKIAGTNWSWYTEYGSPGEWRIECDLPCYAESYAYGYADSYTFAGGGDFKYQDSLSAENLDFKTLLIGRSKELTANVKAGLDFNLLADSITIYDITWLSGDTTYFSMLDTITTPIKMGPGDKLPVRFGFYPTQVRRYEARAWVWSSSRALVYINVVGYGGLMTVEITPTDIDFGRVRVGTEVSQNYNVIFGGDDNLARVQLLASTYPDLMMPPLGFNIPDVPWSEHESGTAYSSFVKFMPMTEGYRDTGFTVYAHLPQSSPDVSEKLHVRLRGRGVQPNVVTEDLDFGEVRIERQSAYREIEIRNIGTDTTQILSVEMESGDIDDFTLETVSLPQVGFMLDTTDVTGSRYRFRARFNPNDTGMKVVNIKIRTLEQTIFSKLTGRGVEPYVIAVPDVIDFGTIDGSDPVVNPTQIFAIHNIGTYEAVLNWLQQSTEGQEHFVLRPLNVPQTIVEDTLSKSDSIQVEVTFLVDKVGEYFDTVSIFNDTRNQPLVFLRGRVRTDLVITPPEVNFDTIRDCDPVDIDVTIHNPNKVGVVLDTIFFAGDPKGFSFGGTTFSPKNINISPGDSFTFTVRYEFPPELLSGEQHAKVVIYQLTGDELVRLEINLEVYRSIRTLSLITVKPAYTPNVSDAEPFKLPIRITGGHEGLTEFDNYELVLRFDNDLFRPVGIIQAGTLSEVTPGQGSVSYQPYDAVTRTFTVTGKGLQVSQRTGDLLLIVLVEALLTVDTTAIVTPELNLDQRPCAYAIDKQGIQLEYANDCGDILLRDRLRDGFAFKIISANPDPLVVSASSAINFRYELGYDAVLECDVLNTSGAVVTRLEPIQARAGEGTIEIAGKDLPATGLYVLRISERPAAAGSNGATIHTQTFRAIR